MEVDNVRSDKKPGGTLFSDGLYQIYAMSGVYVMAINEKVSDDEYKRLIGYLKVMYDYMKHHLKYASSALQKPAELVSSILSTVTDELPRINISISMGDTDDSNTSDEKSDLAEEDDEKSLEELLEELNSLIGLDEVKYDVTTLTNLLRIKAMREDMGLKMPPISMHLVFSGNPGTGKTTVARLLAKLYKNIGVLSKGQLVETDRSGLVGAYVGHTALKVNDAIERAKGGVLFIDEAYSLTRSTAQNDYGAEAVDTLLKAMEDNREDLIVIVAGYPELMEGFLESNPGLKSRFNKFIYFRDYTPDELTEIFLLFCKNNGYRATRPALSYVNKHFTERCEADVKNFANAREVRNLFEYALSRQANRVVLINNPTKNDLTLLTLSDVFGEDLNVGKQQFMAKLVMDDMTR